MECRGNRRVAPASAAPYCWNKHFLLVHKKKRISDNDTIQQWALSEAEQANGLICCANKREKKSVKALQRRDQSGVWYPVCQAVMFGFLVGGQCVLDREKCLQRIKITGDATWICLWCVSQNVGNKRQALTESLFYEFTKYWLKALDCNSFLFFLVTIKKSWLWVFLHQQNSFSKVLYSFINVIFKDFKNVGQTYSLKSSKLKNVEYN